MKKIISVFQRNYEGDRHVRDEVVPGAEWVLAGDGVGTRKWDGTCCLVRGGKLYKRYDAKKGKTPPPGFEPAQNPDSVTGHWPGWLTVGDGPDDRWHREAWEAVGEDTLADGTYELVGPKVSGGKGSGEPGFGTHRLIRHGGDSLDIPRTFSGMKEWLASDTDGIEGVVFHHPDGRMAKIKKSDYGIPRR